MEGDKMDITVRERQVLLFLLQTQGNMTVKDAAKALDVSTRTIHRDLKGIEKILFDHHLELERKAGVGLRILGKDTDKQALEYKLSTMTFQDYTREERKAIILSFLLETNEPVKLIALANELDVSVATVSYDLDELEKELDKSQLHIVRKKGYGITIEGHEANKRYAITHLISKYLDPSVFVSLLKENIQNRRGAMISNRLLGLVNPERLKVIEKTVGQAIKALPYELADSAYVGLVVHLALAVERLLKGDTIEFDQEYLLQIKGTTEYRIAEKIINHLKSSLDIDIPADEIGYITMHLKGARLREDQHLLLQTDSPDIVYQVKQLIAYVSDQVPADLTSNSQLLNDLLTHLKPAIYRLRKQMKITNPMVDEIRRDYYDLFQLIKEATENIFPELDFPEDEIGYLVLHFAAALLMDDHIKALVICSSGIGSAKILATKLMKQVPQINQVENKSLFDVTKDDLKRYDVVIFTIPLENLAETDYIRASPMLDQSDIDHVKKAIKRKKLYINKDKQVHSPDAQGQLETIKQFTDSILDLLQSFYVQDICHTESVLQAICMDLEKRKIITDSEHIVIKLLKRERSGGLGIPKTTLALYHTRSHDVQSLHFSIHPLETSVFTQGMDGKNMEVKTILMMLAPQDMHQAGLETLSYLSSLLIQKDKAIQLFESGDEAAIQQFLAHHFHAFLKDKQLL